MPNVANSSPDKHSKELENSFELDFSDLDSVELTSSTEDIALEDIDFFDQSSTEETQEVLTETATVLPLSEETQEVLTETATALP
ncbi:MAG: hypothetical protein F6K11_25195, partial [Leptolyngbya sp. SIO3F4]|nr:hypothetical protein [Leptolyngbya sp. SIO3F4]